MIRLIELSPAAGDALVASLATETEEVIYYRRLGTRFIFSHGNFPHRMFRLNKHVDSVLAKYGLSHLTKDTYT